MTIRRKVLLVSTGLVFTSGVALVSVPFIFSLGPSEKARFDPTTELFIDHLVPGSSTLKVIDPGGVRHHGSSRSVRPGWGIYVVRASAGDYFTFTVPVLSGGVLMPDRMWGRQGYSCQSFVPSKESGLVTKESTIHCADDVAPQWYAEEWRWRITGENVSGLQPDMIDVAHQDLPSGINILNLY